MNIAHLLTLLRMLISPFFLLVYVYHKPLGLSPTALPCVLFALFGISELSDAFDGFLARRYGQVTELGKLLDPMADSISRITAFLTFTQPPVNLSIFLVFLFIYRDSVVSTLRTLCALRGFALAARPRGKVKAVLQAVAIFTILLLMLLRAYGSIGADVLYYGSFFTALCAALYALYSSIDYIRAFSREIARMNR